MKKNFSVLISLSISNFVFPQIGKDGNLSTSSNTVVNQYYTVAFNVNSGDNYVVLSTAPALSPGDLILLIQMQGASVNSYANPSNTLASLPNTNYGAITNYNNAGNYEFNQVTTVNGNSVYVICPFQKNYTALGKTQLIRVPRFNNLTVNSSNTLYGLPWNGNTGGVVAVEVSGTLTINANAKISADTIGFRGGITNLRTSNSAYGVGDMGHLDKLMGVYKGESIAGDTGVYASQFSGRFCKGAVANGGGGGNSLNAGGGGGANAGDTSMWNGMGNPDISNSSWITAWNLESPGFASNVSSGGGRGGYTYSSSNKNPLIYGPNDYTNWGGDGRSNNGGLGGRPLDYASGRVFLGGGGGGGDSDNGYGGRGGNGGGIIFILNYGQIIANGLISANGRDGYNSSTPTPGANQLTGRDGAGGGGGGGAIIIKTPNPIIGTPTVTARGGNGGNQQMKSGYIFGSPNDAYGPGGGGGGGYIGSNVNISNTNVSGGNNGIVQYLSGSNGCLIDDNFPPNGATKGGAGIVTNTLTPPDIITISPSTITLCEGSVLTATAVTTNTTLPIEWYSSFSSTVSVATGSVLSTNTLVAGTYTFYAGQCPGWIRTSIQITVVPNPSITVNNATICSGQSATLIANGASSYTWNTGATTNSIIVNPTVSTNYTVSGGSGSCIDTRTAQVIVNPSPTISVNSPTICSGQSATLIASGASSYTWNTGATTNSILVNPISNANYTVTGDNGACTTSQTTQVVVIPTPTISVNNATICSGQSATLIANGATSYTWNTGAISSSITSNPITSTTYTITGENSGCISTTTAQIIVNNPPVITVNNPTICSGQNATLTASGATSYTWNTGALTNSIIVFPSSTSTYTVTGEQNNCVNTQTAIVVVNTAPSLTLIPDVTTVCQNNCVTFNYAPTTYSNVMFNYGSGISYQNYNCYNTIGTYTAVASGTYTNGCVNTSSLVTINVIPNPTADFNLPNEAYTGDIINFNNNSSGAQLFNWSFGDGNSINTFSYNISHSYANAGNYCILLTAIDTSFLCSDTITKCIRVLDNFEIEIPNVFTPNNDGTNDVFKVRSKAIKEFYGQIYDRWGVLLFEWDNVNDGWNGYLKNNSKAPTGTYYYLIKCILLNGEIKEYKGYLTLLE
ncbi:MAG: hypothetical protein KatS3mg027_1700 [Bacteroidia bacterium]|nr:MAG: hypothetical protein KatS3mg027_1700 [Bacteroidia bacterium]